MGDESLSLSRWVAGSVGGESPLSQIYNDYDIENMTY